MLIAYINSSLRRKRLDAGLRAPQDQRMDIVCALVGIDRFQVHYMANDVILVGDAVAAVHIARHAGDLECLAAGIAFDQ